MDRQQYKLIVAINFAVYPVENGKMLPTCEINEKYIDIHEGNLISCQDYIEDFIRECPNTPIKTRG